MGIIKSAVSLGVVVGAFYLGYRYNEGKHEEQQVRVDIKDSKPNLVYFGKIFELSPGPRLGTLDERISTFIMDYQEHPEHVKSVLQRFSRYSIGDSK